jgi:hypothetical protein
MSRPRGEGLRRTEREIVAEKAAALGRAGERLEQALADAADLGRRLVAARDAAEQRRLLAEYERARARAHQARLALLVQREAVGLRHHRVVDQAFPEPPPPFAPPQGPAGGSPARL